MNIRTLVTLSVLCAASLTLGYAQQSETLRVHIPFAFVAGGKELPAGDYTLLQSIAQHPDHRPSGLVNRGALQRP